MGGDTNDLAAYLKVADLRIQFTEAGQACPSIGGAARPKLFYHRVTSIREDDS